VVRSGSFDLPVDFVAGSFFTTDRAGTIVATVDYTFANSDILVWIARGECTFEQFVDDTCTYAATSFSGGDPRSVAVAGAAAGTCTLIVYNGGPADEAFSVQVVLTPSAATVGNPSAGVAKRVNLESAWRGRAARARTP
jgi:hypothetical protein